MPIQLLIVDDELDIREFAAKFFQKRKINLLSVSNGEEAIRLVVEQQPQVVLLDIQMPGIDGFEALARIRELNKHIKVIMITGRDDVQAKHKAQELGAYGYIHKPLELDELEKVVMKLLDKAKEK